MSSITGRQRLDCCGGVSDGGEGGRGVEGGPEPRPGCLHCSPDTGSQRETKGGQCLDCLLWSEFINRSLFDQC